MSPQITTQKLNNNNYLQWSRAVEVYLTGQGYEDHLTSNPPTVGTEEAKAWIKIDNQIISLLWNSMEPHIADMWLHRTVKEIWEFVKMMYSGNLARLYNVFHDLFQAKQNGRPLSDYFGITQRAYEELNVLQPFSVDIAKQKKQREELVVLSFLAGLSAEYEPVKAHILGGASLPSLAEVYHRLAPYSRSSYIGQDKSASAAHSPQLHVETLFIGNRGGHGGRSRTGRGIQGGHGGKGPLKCINCGRENHTREYCWELIGRSPKTC